METVHVFRGGGAPILEVKQAVVVRVDAEQTGGEDLNGDRIDDHSILADTDADGTPDHRDLDSDDDDISDWEENPPYFAPTDRDRDGIPDGADADYLEEGDHDGDGIADPYDPDVTGGEDLNGDGIDDHFTIRDTDEDGIEDFRDWDSDNDGASDELEGTVDSD